jgi:hypothetical protein
MSTLSARDLEAQLLPPRLGDLPHEALVAVREHSKRMFGNQDRLEVAVAITRVQLGKVNATDLNRDIDVAVNRIRTQLLALEALGLLEKTGKEDGKRMFKRCNPDDHFWKFVIAEYELVVGPSSSEGLREDSPAPRHPPDPVTPKHRR